MSEIQERIESLLRNTEREGIENLIEYLKKEEFFTSPGSTKYHGCYNGGLAKHSLNVFERVRQANEDFKLDIDYHSIVITCLLHDVCKVGAYLGTEKPYRWNRQQPCGHAKLSIDRIKQFIQLTELEEMLTDIGFGNVSARSVTRAQRFLPVESLLEYVKEKPISTFALLSERDFEMGMTEYEKRLREKHGNRVPYWDEYSFVLGEKI